MKSNVVLVLGAFVILAGCAWYLLKTPAHSVQAPINTVPGARTIVLTKDGFVPDKITIKKGETITFSTDTRNLFWPASNLHPSHLLYPEFDPKDPIEPDSSWSFTFEKVGQWGFHDHLAPYFTGTITVTE